MSQKLNKAVVASDGTKIENVQQLLQEIGRLEEKAYVQGMKDTLIKVVQPLKSISALLERTIANIEATIAADEFVNKADQDSEAEPVPPEVDAPPLVEE
jgi:hypothetical protein